MVQTLDDEVRDAAASIADRANTLATKNEPVVVALPHQPRSARTFKTGYAFVDGTEWWSKKRPAAVATEFKTKVTTALRMYYGIRVVSLHQSITHDDWRAVAAGFSEQSSSEKDTEQADAPKRKKRAIRAS